MVALDTIDKSKLTLVHKKIALSEKNCIENLFPFPIDFEVKNYLYQHDESEVSPLP